MLAAGKVTLAGSLLVVDRHCTCCNSKDMLRLTDDEGREFFYCKSCFSDNCKCGGKETVTIEK